MFQKKIFNFKRFKEYLMLKKFQKLNKFFKFSKEIKIVYKSCNSKFYEKFGRIGYLHVLTGSQAP